MELAKKAAPGFSQGKAQQFTLWQE